MGLPITLDDIDKHYGTSGKRKPVNPVVLEKTQVALANPVVNISGTGTVIPGTSNIDIPDELRKTLSEVSAEPRSA